MERYAALMERAQEWIDAHREEFITELQGFVRIPSVSRADLASPGMPFGPDCRRVLDHALARGRHYGFRTEDHDGYAASLCLGDGENCIGIAAHLDVVPEGEGWVYPPYGATWLPEHNTLIGRGADDNKGAAVAALFAMRILRDTGWPLRRGVRLMLGTSEETGMQDMKHLRQTGFRFPAVSLVPDAGFPVNYGQKGNIDAALAIPCEGTLVSLDAGEAPNVIPASAQCVLACGEAAVRAAMARLDETLTAPITVEARGEETLVTAAGRAGHAAFPAGGDNAIMRLCAFLDASGLLRGSCAGAIRELTALTADAYGQSEGAACSDEASGPLTLVYGMASISGGMLRVTADCRFPITAQGAALAAQLQQHWAGRGFTVTAFELTEPFHIPRESPVVETLQAVYRTATGREDAPYVMGGGTYSKAIPNAVSFGPGMPGKRADFSAFLPPGHGQYHGPDEAVCMEKLYDCCRIYTAAIAALDDLVP